MTNKPPRQPWWREPWPWFLMAGPALAMLGCIVTIVLAVSNFGDEAITQGAVKRGLLVEHPDNATKNQAGDSQP